MASKHLSGHNLYQFKSIDKDHLFSYAYQIKTEVMAVKLFLGNILLLQVCSFKGFQINIKMIQW